MLTNAVYFNAAWQTKFDPAATRRADFTRRDGSRVAVDTMAATRKLRYGEGVNHAAVLLPYDGGELSMALILPASGQIEAFEAALTPARLTAILDGMTRHTVSITLPKFAIASSFSLAEPATAQSGSQHPRPCPLWTPRSWAGANLTGFRKRIRAIARVLHTLSAILLN